MMENYTLFVIGIMITCFVIVWVIFQFMDERYKRTYHSNYLYLGVKIGISVLLMGINLLDSALANIISWILVFGIASFFLYYDDNGKFIQRILEAEVMILVFAICEAIGVILLDFILWEMGITKIDVGMKKFLDMTFSMLVVLFLFYSFISRIWSKKGKIKFTKTQYILHGMIAGYSFLNMLIIIETVERVNESTAKFLLLLSMGFIVFADMYFLYFIRFIKENNQLKLKFNLLKQQAEMQYRHYELMEQQSKGSIEILHDISKHIKMIEDLYRESESETAITYTREINDAIKMLYPRNYSNNPILNILLHDKFKYASNNLIEIKCDIQNVDLKFIKPIDITTIFGNLLDNAIEACMQVRGNRHIHIKIFPYYEMIGIRIENTTPDCIVWENGRPVSKKGENHGIGLHNVEHAVEKYDGTMNFSKDSECFQCNIIINR